MANRHNNYGSTNHTLLAINPKTQILAWLEFGLLWNTYCGIPKSIRPLAANRHNSLDVNNKVQLTARYTCKFSVIIGNLCVVAKAFISVFLYVYLTVGEPFDTNDHCVIKWNMVIKKEIRTLIELSLIILMWIMHSWENYYYYYYLFLFSFKFQKRLQFRSTKVITMDVKEYIT